MGTKFGVIMDPIQSISFAKDSTLAILLAAQRQGFELFYMQQDDLFIDNGEPKANLAPLRVFDDPNRWFELSEYRVAALEEMDVLLMRKDPLLTLSLSTLPTFLKRRKSAVHWWSTNPKVCATAMKKSLPPTLPSAHPHC